MYVPLFTTMEGTIGKVHLVIYSEKEGCPFDMTEIMLMFLTSLLSHLKYMDDE